MPYAVSAIKTQSSTVEFLPAPTRRCIGDSKDLMDLAGARSSDSRSLCDASEYLSHDIRMYAVYLLCITQKLLYINLEVMTS
jgi:hypothetical protein